jgi:O-antigen ligase
VYRFIENLNVAYTIHLAPIAGVGFGKKFHIFVQMPDISSFLWWEYITHNSIVWIWIKTGVGGFISLLYMIGFTLICGARTLHRLKGGDMSAIALMALLYLMMHFSYAYVDMSWDLQSMLYVGSMMGVLNSIENYAI